MDILLHKLGISVRHLSILHETLKAHYAEYDEENRRVEAIGLEIFARQLYAGGKVGMNVERQMVLADVFQYIFVGRGYFAALESPDNMRKFIELLFRVANLLIMQENLSVDTRLRSLVIDELEANIDDSDFFEPGYPQVREELQALKNYHGEIVGDAGQEHDNIFDSLLPKRLGLAVELIVYAMLHLKRYGYVVPLLLTQRLIRGGCQNVAGQSGVEYLAPPDFLLFREKGQVFGVEVGSAKDDQNAKFSLVTSIPLFSVRLGSHWQPQPYRCGMCQKWITYSSHVITGLIAGSVSTDIDHINADGFLRNEIPNVTEKDLAFYGDAADHNGKVKKLRYHYSCVKDQDLVKERVEGRTRHQSTGLIVPIPFVKGLEMLKED